jgi:hypothetical protein
MPIFRPKSTGGGGNKYMGIVPVSILEYTNRSSEFDWADLFMEITLKVEDSDYTKPLRITGEFEKDSNGKISGGPVLNKIYRVLDSVQAKVGLNIDGNWEDEEGNEISDIGAYLTDNHTTEKVGFPFVAYVYKSVPKKPGDQSYTRVYPKLWDNDEKGKAKCAEDIAWLKNKGYLKELDPAATPAKTDETLSDGAIANL